MSITSRHNIHQSGCGRPLLFAHGYGCDQNVWRFVAPAFTDTHRVVLFDYAGCGGAAPGSYDFERHRSLAGHADDLIEICDEVGLEDVVLVAHSVSAMVGVLAARRRPDLFHRLVLLAPSPCYLNVGDYRGGFERDDIDGLLEMLETNHFGWARMMAPVIMGNGDRPALSRELEGNFCRVEPQVAKHFASVAFLADQRADLGGLRVPSLILQCSDDALAPPTIGSYLQQRMAKSTLVRMKATGHCPHLSAPKETIAAIRDYLERSDEFSPAATAIEAMID